MTMSRNLHARGGFTLIELIGVLAIIAILAAVIAPNAVRTLDRAAVVGEDETVARLGEQLQLYVREQIRKDPATSSKWLPTTGPLATDGTWATAIGTYSDLSTVEIQRNRRGGARMLVFDPASNGALPSARALLLSSMRDGRNLPGTVAAAAANFQTIWNSSDEEIPFLLNWQGWSRTPDGNNGYRATDGEHLVVERINLQPLYLDEARVLTITLNNASRSGGTGGTGPSGSDASYQVFWARGGFSGPYTIRSTDVPVVRKDLHRGDRIDLFDPNGVLNYSYAVNAEDRTLEFDGVQWRAR